MAVRYRYNSLVDGTGPHIYKYVIPYTTYHLNTSHIYHFVIYILHIDIYLYISFFSVTWRDSFVQFMHIFVTVSLLRLSCFPNLWVNSPQHWFRPSQPNCSKSRVAKVRILAIGFLFLCFLFLLFSPKSINNFNR